MSELARKLIAENVARRELGEDASYLDLGNCGLRELPDLSHMHWLETLIVSNGWMDEEQNKWVNSQNMGPENNIAQPPAHPLPDSLRKLVFGGDYFERWSVGDGRFLGKLTALTSLYLRFNQISDGLFLENLTALTSLDLSFNQISDGCFLENLTALTSLDLSNNQISDGRFLKKLTGLTLLNLSSNQISDGCFLGNLTALTSLNLSSNEINDWSFLRKMTALTSLNLSYNKIGGGRFLENLTALTSLNLSSNEISDWRFLKKLIKLRSLNLSSNEISDLCFLEKLAGLTYLDLRGNQISDGRCLEKLKRLIALYLSSNQISDWRFLEKMTGLTYLDLSSNKISDGAFLGKLIRLNSLDLSDNEISDWRFLEKMTGLTYLDLSSNKISDGAFLGKLIRLTSLDLSDNEISDGRFLEKMTGLTSLNLSGNQISDGRFLEKLTGLASLNLSGNQISDGRFLEKLTGLRIIDLVGNKLQDLAPFLYFMQKKGMQVVLKESYGTQEGEINLNDNPLATPPPEIVQQGNTAILEYFRQKEKAGIKPLLEAKMVLLGDGRAGKTSLACRLLGKELPRQEDRTQGVDIVIGEYRFPVEEGEFMLHIWDFAGQDKYKPLHQFFYTEGAVYVMVVDSGNAQTDFADWFETAEMFGGEGSPLLVALNEFREGMGKGAFDEEKWRKQFPKLIKEVRLVNLLSQEGFPALEKDIRHLADQLPHTRTAYPTNWANIRAELERRRDENYISLKEYLKICRQLNLPERESGLVLSGILHRIGVCLHYQKSDLLRQHVILKNEWATAAVYKILEDSEVAETKKGFFDRSDLRRIWSDESYQDMQPQLLALMCEFKMAYPLPNQREFVTPPLLPTAPPQDWGFPVGDTIEVRVEYEFLPKALMTQFIVSRHRDIDRGRTLVWREGVVLRWSANTLAQVSKTRFRGRDAFQIRAVGSDRRGLLTAILKTLRDLHAEYRGIRAHEIVPCPCKGCRTEKNPQHYFEFKNLTNRLEKGRRVVECDQSLEEVDLVKILGDLLMFERLGIGEAVVLKDVQQEEKKVPLRVFISYSKADRTYLDTTRKLLRPIARNNKIALWDDTQLLPAEDADNAIRRELLAADIIIFLVSADLMATDYIWDTEMKEAMARAARGEVAVVPVIIRSCVWDDAPFAQYTALPGKGKPISSWSDPDEAWKEVMMQIQRLIKLEITPKGHL